MSFISGQDCTGVLVASLPTLNHNVSGMMYVENDTTFCISNFFYDGGGPGEYSPCFVFVCLLFG